MVHMELYMVGFGLSFFSPFYFFGLLPTPLCYSDMEYPDGAGRAWASGSFGAQWGSALQI